MKRIRPVATIFTCATIVAFAMVFSSTAMAKTMELTYAAHHGPTDIHCKLMTEWIKAVEEKSNGAVKISFFPGQALVKAPKTYDAVVNGLADMGFAILQYTRGRFPMMDFINMPLGYPNGAVNTAIINEVYEKFQPKELMDTKVLYLSANPPSYIHTIKEKISKMEDLKGLKIRSNGPTADMIKALGGTPVALPMPELYQALQKGVVNGAIYDYTATVDWKLGEVTSFTVQNKATAPSLGFFNVMNKQKWDALDPALQKAIDELDIVWAGKHGAAWDESAKRGTDYIAAKKGSEIVTVEGEEGMRWKEAVKPVVDTYLSTMASKGLPGEEVLEYVQKRIADAENGTFESKYMMK